MMQIPVNKTNEELTTIIVHIQKEKKEEKEKEIKTEPPFATSFIERSISVVQ